MRVVVLGASGNAGTSVLAALAGEDRVSEIVGVARRIPEAHFPKVSWRSADISDPNTDLAGLMRGADCVVQLAWLIQPSRDGMHDGAGVPTPPLSPQTTAPERVREVLTGVGRTSR